MAILCRLITSSISVGLLFGTSPTQMPEGYRSSTAAMAIPTLIEKTFPFQTLAAFGRA